MVLRSAHQGARSVAMNDAQSPPKSDVQDRYFGLLRCVGCFPVVCSEDAFKGIFDDHGTARRALKSADIAENRLSGLGASAMRAPHCGQFGRSGSILCPSSSILCPSNGISILQRGSPWSGSAFDQRLHAARVVFLDARDFHTDYRMPDWAGAFVVKHRAEIVHIKPAAEALAWRNGMVLTN